LSNNFAQNIGSDDTMVFSGSLDVIDTGFSRNMGIVLDRPFVFDPRVGDLTPESWT